MRDPGAAATRRRRCARGLRAGARPAERVQRSRVSPDDKHVYVASSGADGVGSNAIAAFSRAGDTGALTSAGCVSDSGGDGRPGTDGFCADGDALLGASGIAVSPDGRHVYVASHSSNGIAWLARDAATGKLTPAGCIKNFPRADRCRAGFGLEGTSGVAVSPDGKQVYVTADKPGSVSVFSRDADTRRPAAGHVRERERLGRAVRRRHRARSARAASRSRPTGARCS